MKRSFPIYLLLAFFFGSMASSCDSDEFDQIVENDQEALEYSVMVNAFNLTANDTIMMNLDSVFFAIDLDRAEIFNPDSLPKGVSIGKIPVKIDLPGVSEATITMPSDDGKETTTVNYLENKDDSINFKKGEVKLHLKSYNGKVSRDYVIKVNVHQLEPDSLTWDKMAVRPLPGTLSGVTTSRTLAFGDEVLCFTGNGTSAQLSRCENPFSGVWTSSAVSLPAGAIIRSITATSDALYLVDASGNLYKSANGSDWASTGARMHHIYGGYLESVVGVVRGADGVYRHASYPGGVSSAVVTSDFPVEGTSSSVTYSTKWASKPMMMVTGGKTASGSLSGSTWAYDGGEWACVTQKGYEMPPVTGATMFPYFTFTTDYTNWEATKYDMLFAVGGMKADGTCNKDIYLSPDRGVHWAASQGLLAKPGFLPNLYNLDGLVRENTMYVNSRSASGWKEYATKYPRWFYPVYTLDGSRAVTPITEWECPFVYLFGGNLADGKFNNQVWRGVINRLVFRPVQ